MNVAFSQAGRKRRLATAFGGDALVLMRFDVVERMSCPQAKGRRVIRPRAGMRLQVSCMRCVTSPLGA